MTVGHSFFEPFIFFADVSSQFVRLHGETRIVHFHVAGKFANVFRGIEESFIRINLGRDSFSRVRQINRARFFLSSVLFRNRNGLGWLR